MSKAIPCPKGCGATVYVPAYDGDGAYGPNTLENHVCNPEWKPTPEGRSEGDHLRDAGRGHLAR